MPGLRFGERLVVFVGIGVCAVFDWWKRRVTREKRDIGPVRPDSWVHPDVKWMEAAGPALVAVEIPRRAGKSAPFTRAMESELNAYLAADKAETPERPEWDFFPPGTTHRNMTNSELHERCAHPDWEYATTEGPRKRWDHEDVPPEGGGWLRNVYRGRDGWERFEYTEEAYWRRYRPEAEGVDLFPPGTFHNSKPGPLPDEPEFFDKAW